MRFEFGSIGFYHAGFYENCDTVLETGGIAPRSVMRRNNVLI
jgi:hypothetical protein